ncbi:DUF2283 domain-containing protein [Streptomyces bobili]|uniref:DUF2283 domain-containing protein n=1 Tax=Streptomyces bobili TaxID=67280 RepID=UPI0033AF7648
MTYDQTADAAYVHFPDPRDDGHSALRYPCDPVNVDGMINLDFDERGRPIGIQVPAPRSKLPEYVLKSAERLDPEPPRSG